MIIFTPNTVIKSADVNTNFSAVANIANWSNPYKFSAYMSATQVLGTATWTKANFDTESYDTNNNFDTSTKGYTIPIDGFYSFTVGLLLVAQAGNYFLTAISTDGVNPYMRLGQIPNTTGDVQLRGTMEGYFTAGTVVYALAYSTTASKSIYNTFIYSQFCGHLISAT